MKQQREGYRNKRLNARNLLIRCHTRAMSVEHLRKDLVIDAELAGNTLRFHTTWGLFSPRAIDEGTLLLLQHLEVRDDDVALDMGCGYGPLGLSIAQRAPRGSVHLVDKDFLAVQYTQANAERNELHNTHTYLSNGFSHVPGQLRLSLVVSNLPAKVGNEFFQILFHDARTRMLPGARIVVVTINGLRDFVKRSFNETFGNYSKLKQGKSYTVSMATLPD
ncbi:MAG: methyltransferase [Granulosicoccus sp.]|nr:methyltransferase [Granulosicoccus sp.]